MIKKLLKKTFLYKIYINFFIDFDERSKKNLSKNGNKYILELEDLLKMNDIKHFFDFGTLLGIVRDGGVISGDGDIDIGVFIINEIDKEKIKNILKNKKVKLLRRFVINDIGTTEESYSYRNKVRFDLHYYFENEGNRYCYLFYCSPEKQYQFRCFDAVKINLKKFEIGNFNFCGKNISMPTEPEKILVQKYGTTWRIPDGGWPYWEGPCAEKTDLIGKAEIFIK